MPGGRLYRLRTDDIRNHPFRTRRHLRRQIGIARRRHILGRSGNHVDVRHYRDRCRTLECLLGVLIGNGCPEGGISVHRCCRGHGEITLLMMMGCELAEVVDGAGSDRNGDCAGLVQLLVQQLDMVPVGMEFIFLEEEFFRGDTCGLHGLEDLRTCHAPGVPVGHQEGLAAGEKIIE